VVTVSGSKLTHVAHGWSRRPSDCRSLKRLLFLFEGIAAVANFDIAEDEMACLAG
jgi:hypothetical protein